MRHEGLETLGTATKSKIIYTQKQRARVHAGPSHLEKNIVLIT